ncbi:hypothetical protein [Gracilimonas sp.]|uniref:hypothetical protein n=1 Tax=Gracilimonas sp. TaxID=1974203 RepID=UPI0028710176|nr:hypothetical protein [Gracilimonas sp.]
MSKSFEPIPIPREQKIREFRHRILPVIIFILIALFVFYLWNKRVTEAGFTAKVMADSSLVASPYDGTLKYYSIAPFDDVEKGDPVARITRVDSSYLQARLDHIRAMINQVEVGLEPYLNQQRNLLDYESIRLDNIDYRVQVATLKVEVQQLKAEYERAKILVDKDGISRSEFDLIESEYQVAQTELDEKIELT